ncbi:MAG: UDP-3-O-acyl-N-acetylglucosamine deacetylase [Bdellovibrionota bacterium]
MSEQTTLKRKITLRGVGLHAGARTTCVIHPAPANHGVIFLRSDLATQPRIRAEASKVVRTDLSTTLGSEGVVVATIEHLMAALSGMGVDNALVEVDGPEVPIMDGSSREFADAIADAGVRTLAIGRKALRLKQKVCVRVGDKFVLGEPAKKLSIKGSIQFNHRVIGEQTYKFSSDRDFRQEIASARTFGFLKEVQFLHSKGLALGGSLDNALVLDEERLLNSEGLRYQNEFVRHKILDALGDLALFGMPRLEASIEVHKAGHELHALFVRKVLEDSANYEIIDLKSAAQQRQEQASEELLADEELAAGLAHAY